MQQISTELTKTMQQSYILKSLLCLSGSAMRNVMFAATNIADSKALCPVLVYTREEQSNSLSEDFLSHSDGEVSK